MNARARTTTLGGAVALAMVVAACSGTTPPRKAADSDTASVPAAARKIMADPAYRSARWTYQVSDLKSGEVLLANRPDEFVFTASSAKQFTVGAAYDVLGAESSLTTPVYAVGERRHGVLHGNLALVASGDLTMGGRNAFFGRDDSSFTATTVDHVYGDIAPNAVKPPGNPLVGLDNLASQIAADGIHRIAGDVVIDDRLWQTFDGQEGPVAPIFINDNLLDITVTPSAAGTSAAVAASPRTAAYDVHSQVRTTPGSDAALHVVADAHDPHRLIVTGTIGVKAGPRLTVYRVPDAASWGRTLFIEALQRAGIAVTAPTRAANDVAALPAKGSYPSVQRVAKLESPPLSAFGSMILQTSYNTGANAMLCLLAVHEKSTDCLDGLAPMRCVIQRAGLADDDVVLVDGQGADPASVTPAAMVDWLRWTQSRPWAAVFKAGQPVLGERGSLASHGRTSPAKGKVAAKTATSLHPDPATGRILFNVQALAGFITTDDGRTLVFDLSMSGGTYPDLVTGLVQSGHDLAEVAAAFQQSLSQ